ncbi:hypothetical protein [Mycolicibacterium sp. CBMA 226]|uniref:hypothetical protein n=1 Tax=Mycolicibacterium sp. CBMA 226 TaxID=2606611 RepID=UPI001AA0BE8B|nr:hypothetical protein [Mycolicibacterium sp. CBMA 226]
MSEQTDSVTTENTGPESTQTVDNAPTEVTTTETGSGAPTGEAEAFTREYVTGLRDENAKYRLRAKETAEKLHTEVVRATGLLADPSDLPFSEEHLTNPDALVAAVEQLITAKPHLKARRVTGDVGQGVKDQGSDPVSLLDMLRSGIS